MNGSLWRRRRSRAIELLATAPHADKMLEFYVGLVELQAGVAEEVSRSNEPASDGFASDESGLGLRVKLTTLPADWLEPLFGRFLADLEEIGTEVIARSARTLLNGDAAGRTRTLQTFWLEGDAADFLPRAFTEPIAYTLANREPPDRAGDAGSSGAQPHDDEPPRDGTAAVSALTLRTKCPTCGFLPQVGVLRDDPGALGRLLLVCSLCATQWMFPRLTCAHCGSGDSDHLQVHEVESTPHLRLEECDACARYLKVIDLRKDGAAEPIVDDLASPELDIWAGTRGLVKVQPNLLGL